MIKEFKTSIGYICPFCSSITIKEINLFDLSGSDTVSFICQNSQKCEEKCVSITPAKKKYTICVECPLCDETHTFNIQKTTFWKNKFLSLNCPESGFGILFIGNRDKVKSEIENQEKMLIEMTDDFSVDGELSVIFDAVERINELAKDGFVTCSCGSHAISIEIDNEKITLCCRECGKNLEIPANQEGLDKLLNTSAIVLD